MKRKYSFARSLIDHDARMASGVRIVASRTRNTLMPSIAHLVADARPRESRGCPPRTESPDRLESKCAIRCSENTNVSREIDERETPESTLTLAAIEEQQQQSRPASA